MRYTGAQRYFLGVFFFVLIFWAQSLPGAERVAHIPADHERLVLGPYVDYLEDAGGRLSIKDVLLPTAASSFTPNGDAVLNFGFVNSTYWIRWKLRNDTPDPIKRRIELGEPELDFVEFYSPTSPAGGYIIKSTGSALPYAEREIANRFFLFDVTLPPEVDQTFYMRLTHAGPLSVPLSLWTAAGFERRDHTEEFFSGIFYGILLIMIAYNGLLAVSLKDPGYLFYILLLTGFTILQMGSDGYDAALVGKGMLGWHHIGLPVVFALTNIAGIQFARTFLGTRLFHPVMDWVLVAGMIAMGLVVLSLPIVGVSLILRVVYTSVIVLGGLILAAGLASYRKGYQPARYFLLACSFCVLGAITIAFMRLGITDVTPLAVHSAEFGFVMLTVFLSFGLADRINTIREENELSRHEKLQEKRFADQQILEWEQRYELVVSSSGQIVYDFSINTGNIDWSGSVAQVLGYTLEEMEGGIERWKELIHPEDRDVTLRNLADAQRRLKKFEAEYRFRAKSGSYIWIFDRGFFAADEHGKAVRMLGMMQDIEERKNAELNMFLLAQTLKYAKDCICITDLDDTILFTNDAFVATYGYSAEELKGKNISVVRPNDTIAPRFREIAPATLQGGWHGELINRRKDGSEFPIEIWTSLVKDNSGRAFAMVGIARDITARKHAEELLRTSQARIQSIVRNIPVVIFALTPDGTFTLCEGKGLETLGISPGKMVGSSAFAPGAQIPWNPADIKRAIDGKRFSSMTERNGFVFETYYTPVQGHDGLVSGVIGVAADITERFRTEKDLKNTLSILSATLESTADGILVVDRQGKIVRFNQKFAQMWNIPSEILGSGKDERALGFVSEQLSDPQEFLSKVTHLYDHPDKNSFDLLKFKDGRVFERYSQPQRVEEKIVGRVWSFRDVTERVRAEESLRESEERFARLSEAAYEGIGISENGIILDSNRQLAEMLGYTPAEIIGKHVIEFVAPESRAVVDEHMRANFEEPYEQVVLRRDGTKISVESRARTLSLEGRVVRVSAIRDITERKRIEEKIRTINEELEQRVKERTAELESVNKELEAFSYSVSHDLRAPLRHIDGFIDMLGKQAGDSLDKKGKRYLSVISSSAIHMGKLIDDLLSFSRMSRMEMMLGEVELDRVVREVIEQMTFETEGRSIEWNIGPLPTVNTDHAMIRQVWFNLISNSVKYTKLRERAKIDIGRGADVPGEVVFFVRDNGVGFDMQYADKLFGVFQRLHKKEDFEGTGIGLANVRRIVHRHGGRTWAESAPDQGATFYFTLPAWTVVSK